MFLSYYQQLVQNSQMMARGILFLYWKSSVAPYMMPFIIQSKGLYTINFSNMCF